ncbi:hypothetical protein Moror_2452, partial [Moniliophthora roreri MCA 2997]
PPRLPIELIEKVLAELTFPESRCELQHCSLVCRAWLPITREHLLPTLFLELSQNSRFERFIALATHPLSSLHCCAFRGLVIMCPEGVGSQPAAITLMRQLHPFLIHGNRATGRSIAKETLWNIRTIRVCEARPVILSIVIRLAREAGCFSRVTQLDLFQCSFDSPELLGDLLNVFPNIKGTHISYPTYTFTPTVDMTLAALPPTFCYLQLSRNYGLLSLFSSCRTLEELILRPPYIDEQAEIVEQFFRDPGNRVKKSHSALSLDDPIIGPCEYSIK